MARRKIVFVIVEGPSDDEALGVLLNRIYDNNVVHLEITHGDITSDLSVTSGNIAAKIGNLVRGYAKANHYKPMDFQEVIHLIDMDGAYIPEGAVVMDAGAGRPVYTTTEIRTSRREQLILRNKRKSANLDRICFMGKVCRTVPYRAYYMSVNLDHVLYDKLNSSDDEKERDAYGFVKKYKDRVDDFLEFITNSDFSVCDDFDGSWEYIKQGKHSLERHTNLGLCFRKIKDEKKDGQDFCR